MSATTSASGMSGPAGTVRVPLLAGTAAWGPAKWEELHLFTIRYPQKPTISDKLVAGRWLQTFVRSLPCEVCRVHAAEYMALTVNDSTLSSQNALTLWGFSFHNAVNKRLGKIPYTWDQFVQRYQSNLVFAGLSA